MEISEENCEMIWKVWKKSKLKCEKIWKIGRKLRKDMENMEGNSEQISKIQKKIVKRYGNYGRKVS